MEAGRRGGMHFNPGQRRQQAIDTACQKAARKGQAGVAQAIVGVDATAAVTDHDQLAPMVDRIEARHAHAPGTRLVDGGFVTKEDIGAVSMPTTRWPRQSEVWRTASPLQPAPATCGS